MKFHSYQIDELRNKWSNPQIALEKIGQLTRPTTNWPDGKSAIQVRLKDILEPPEN